MTQRQMLHAQNLRFPNPERVPKVRYSSLYSLLECMNNMFRYLLSLLNDLVVIGDNAFLVILVIIPGV